MLTALHHAFVLALLALASAVPAAGLSRALGAAAPEGAARAALTGLLGLAALAGLAALVGRGLAWRRGAWLDRSLLPVRMALYAAALGSCALLAWREAPASDEILWMLGAASGLFSSGMLLRTRRLPRAASRLLHRIDLLLFWLLGVAAGVELGLRAAAGFLPSPILVRTSDSSLAVIEKNRRGPGARLYDFPMNRHGYHDEEFVRRPGTRLVASIGDSFSIGVVPHALHFTTVAERLLPGVEIYNVGVSGIGPPEYLHLLLTDVLPLEPDAVVISLFLGNDIAENDRFHEARSSPWRRGDFLLYLVPRRLLAAYRGAARRPLGEAPAGEAGGAPAPLRDPRALIERFPWLGDPALERPTLEPEAFLAIEAGRVWRVFRRGELAEYEKLFPVLRRIREACGAIPLLVLLIPAEIQVEDSLWSRAVERCCGGAPVDREQPPRIVSSWLAGEGIPHKDALPYLRAVEPLADGERHVYQLRDTHLNVRGNEALGRALADLLRPRLAPGSAPAP